MVVVNLWSGLRRFTDGELAIAVEAQTVGEMLEAVVEKYPGLGPIFDLGISVAIDGDISSVDTSRAISEENEIFLLQQMKGG